MGMKKKEETKVLPVPPVPELNVSNVSTQKQPVQAVDSASLRQHEKAGDDKGLVKPYNRDNSISVDAIHKSTLEGATLAQMTIGKNEKEVFELTERYVRFNIELNRKIKGE